MAKHPHYREPLMPGEAWKGKPRSVPADPAIARSGPWARSARGLHSYALGLTWRLALTVFVYLLLLFAVESRSMAIAKFVSVLLPLIGLTCGLVMLIGLARFSNLPPGSPGKPSAKFSAAIFGCAFCLELFSFVLVLQLMGIQPGDWEALHQARENAALAQKVSIWALALGFAHILALLVAFRRLARSLGNDRLAGQTLSVGLTIVLAAAAVLLLKWWLPHAKADVGLAVTLAITSLGLAIAAIALFVRLVNVLADALLASGAGGGLPESKIV